MPSIDSLKTTDAYDWEKQAAYVAGPLAASLLNPIQYASDNLQSITDINSRAITPTRTSMPNLDAPPAMDSKTFEAAKKGLADFVDDTPLDAVIDIDDLVYEILTSLANDSNAYLLAKRNFFDIERKWGDKKELERTTELQNQVAAANRVESWGRVEQSLTSIGLLASGVFGLAAGDVSGLSLCAVTVGSLFLIDQLLDNTVKKTVASWLAKGNREEMANWVNRIQVFCGLSSFAMSMGIDVPSAVQVAMSVAKSAVDTTKNVFEWRLSVQKSVLMELDAETKRAQKNLDMLFTEIQEICNTISQFHENIHHVEEKRQQLAYAMLQFK
ncbi:MAG: hypothetical protein JSR46_04515 [Verrucomicrobia bacterium]|nr:hypothetical protein [Verrucomicrobiota bacterium]